MAGDDMKETCNIMRASRMEVEFSNYFTVFIPDFYEKC